jgi:hypothetical protein
VATQTANHDSADKKPPINVQAEIETRAPIMQTAVTANRKTENSRYSFAAKQKSTFAALSPIPLQKIGSVEQTSMASNEEESQLNKNQVDLYYSNPQSNNQPPVRTLVLQTISNET